MIMTIRDRMDIGEIESRKAWISERTTGICSRSPSMMSAVSLALVSSDSSKSSDPIALSSADDGLKSVQAIVDPLKRSALMPSLATSDP